MAVVEALIIFYLMWGIYGTANFTLDQSLYPLGSMTFTACVVVIATKLQIIEQRYRTYMALIGWVLAVGGWFLWNIILAAIYGSSTNPEYYVKGAFYTGFGRNALWWLTLLVTVSTCLAFEVAVRTLKHAFFPTDVEFFQTLEGDLGVRKRFEEASAGWLHAGWRRGSKKSSLEVEREEERREGEVRDMLRSRPGTVEEGTVEERKGEVRVEEQVDVFEGGGGGGQGRHSTEIQEMLTRRFGTVRRENLARSPV